ncbi:MAG: family 78 glycoside hydrolase catalytic domain, partial [Clostridium sp.]|nr:family 78 glycoside hydrolase catalytic domain [Clostridium sp.]
MKVTNLKINGIENPMGFLFEKLVCSWNIEDTSSKKQSYALIEVSDSEDFTNIIYKKEGKDLKQSGERLDMELSPRTSYFLRVEVTGDKGDKSVSSTCTFETGKMNEEWTADWIACEKQDTFHPVLKKRFNIDKNIARARFYVTGVGLFEAYINGRKLGDEYLAPYLNNYENNIQVMTYDAENLTEGENVLEIRLAKGWYMGVFGLELKSNNYGDRMAALGELHIEYEDKTTECIATDESWTYCGSLIEDSGIYDGEIYNKLLWDNKENPEKKVEVIRNPEEDNGTKNLAKSHLMDRLSLPVKAKEEISVKEIIKTPLGETVLDMGQNFAGFIEFKSNLSRGTKITLDFGEILQGENFYNKNYRDAKSQFVYVSDGEPEIVSPHFTYFGFRYVRVTGWEGEINKDDFVGKVLYSDIERTGYIETAHEKINRLYENTVWGLKSNFMDIPTDCPQRSERLGWTGDAQVFAPTASYHMDTRAFFHKFIKDLREEQLILKGGVPNYLPNIGHKNDVSSVWGDIATLLPDTLFTYYGDIEEVKYAYDLMKDWVDYIDTKDSERGNKYLFDFGFTFGDWLALDGATPTSFKGSTNDTYIASVYYYHSLQIVRKMAERLGKSEDMKKYSSLEEKVKEAVLNEFFTPSGRLAIDTQAAFVIALKFGIYIDKEKTIVQFKERLKKDCNNIKCGFVGAPLLCTVLAECGLYELAYDFLLKEGFPSWLYSVNLGATTIWERWNSVMPDGTISDTGMNSLNHYAYGSVMEFVYGYAAGIRPLEEGFKKAVIAPHPDVRIPYINCSYNSVNGKYVCNFKIEEDGKITVHIEIPFDCTAEVILPGYKEEKLCLEAGSYDYSYMPEVNFRKPYDKNTTLARIAKDEKAMGVLGKYAPAIAGIAASGDAELGADSLEDISHKGFLPFDPEKLASAIDEISC